MNCYFDYGNGNGYGYGYGYGSCCSYSKDTGRVVNDPYPQKKKQISRDRSLSGICYRYTRYL